MKISAEMNRWKATIVSGGIMKIKVMGWDVFPQFKISCSLE